MRSPIMLRTVALYLVVLISKSSSQLVGCDDIGCGTRQCLLGNTSLSSIGVTSFNTSFGSQPLTWTIGISTNYLPEDSSNATYERAYFLGTPPGMNLANSTSAQACALFFEGVSQLINTTDGTCGSALGNSCVEDLLSQAQSTMDGLSGGSANKRSTNNTDTGSKCEQLMATLQSSAPKSCTVTANQNWGMISVRDLAGTDAPHTVSQSSCRATTGTDYQLSLVDTYIKEYPYDLTALSQPFLMGTTPTLTIFSSGSSAESTSGAEAHLSCLKAVPSISHTVNTTVAKSTSVASETSNLSSFVIGIVIIGYFWSWIL